MKVSVRSGRVLDVGYEPSWMLVGCPFCGVGLGERCVRGGRQSGQVRARVHRARMGVFL